MNRRSLGEFFMFLGFWWYEIKRLFKRKKVNIIERTPTPEEKIERYERFLHLINLAQTTLNNEMMKRLIQNADSWSYAHRVGNGELSEEEQQKIVNKRFWKICDYV